MQRQRGFTLIELLVVISIMVITASILFPVFARVRENARRIACQSNLKQIGLGLAQYVQDNDQKFPSDKLGDGWQGWWNVIQPYTKSYQIFICPSAVGNAKDTTDGSGSYGYNYIFFSIERKGPPVSGAGVLSEVEEPARTLVVTEILRSAHPWVVFPPRYPGYSPSCWESSGGAIGRHVAERHLEGGNVLFVDTHVKWLRKSQQGDSNSDGTLDNGLWSLAKNSNQGFDIGYPDPP